VHIPERGRPAARLDHPHVRTLATISQADADEHLALTCIFRIEAGLLLGSSVRALERA
jgi:hypothetical protein